MQFVYAVRCSISSHVSVYSTLEKAQAAEEADRNVKVNPQPFNWQHFSTDMQDVEVWEAEYLTFAREAATITITKYPLDKTPKELAGF